MGTVKELRMSELDDEKIEIQFNLETVPALPSATTGTDMQADTDLLNIEFDNNVDAADRQDCIAAAAIGASMGALNVLWQKRFDISRAHSWGKAKVEDFVVQVAKSEGLGKGGLEDAIRFLERKFPLAADKLTPEFGGGLQHHLRDFSHHPSPVGLITSILTQFTGRGYGTLTDGSFASFDLPDGALVGRDFPEKILFGTINWSLHLVSDMAGSSSSIMEGTGIPGPILSAMKELSSLSLFRNARVSYEEQEITLSQWISKLFNGTAVRDKDGNPVRLDLRTEVGLADQALSQAKSVIANECLVRGHYFLTRLARELKRIDARSLGDLSRIDGSRVVPSGTRSLRRMLTISSSVFVFTNLGIACAEAGAKFGGSVPVFAREMLLNVNFVGIARMVVAIGGDANDIADDLRGYLEHKAEEDMAFTRDFKLLALSSRQARILLSYQAIATEKDALATKDEKLKATKLEWLRAFKSAQTERMGADADEYFLDEAGARSELDAAVGAAGSSDPAWLTLLTLELCLFRPYYPFDDTWKRKLKGIKYTVDYTKKGFSSSQDVVSQKRIDDILKKYRSYVGSLSGSTKKVAAEIGAATLLGVATGGLAYALAPVIASALAGEAVVGLSGAALTSASLAAVGGGSLAAGGLGMAGGTAIIAGGGTLLGTAAGVGVAGLVSVGSPISEKFVLDECAKLLTFCSNLPTDSPSVTSFIRRAKNQIDNIADKAKEELEAEKSRGRESDRKAAKNKDKASEYLNRCSKELQRLLEKCVPTDEYGSH